MYSQLMDMKFMPVHRFEVFINKNGSISLFPFRQEDEYNVARRSSVYHTINGHTARYILASEQHIPRATMIEIACLHNKGRFTDVDFTK